MGSDRQIEEYKAAFSLFDKDGDGTISATEFGTILRSLGQNPKDDELKDMMSRFDGDGGGSIDFAEFLDLIAGKMKTFGENESSIRRAFRSLDKDHSGYITVKELKEVLNKLGEKMTTKEVQAILDTQLEVQDILEEP